MPRPSIAFVMALSALAGALAAVVYLGPGQNQQGSSGKALIGGPFSLTDHTGRRVTEKTFENQKTLVFFGFTSCPDICPAGLQTMAAAFDQLGAKADRITPIFITVDPGRDTPSKLSEYVKSFHPRLIGLTGTEDEVKAAAKAYRIYYQKVPNEANPQDYSVDHSSFFYLMDEQGRYLRHFPHAIDAATLATELAKAL